MKKECIVITGGDSGLGLELVRLFVKANKQVVSISMTKKQQIKDVIYFYGNISDEKFVKNVYKTLEKEFYISYLINNAGVGLFGSPKENNAEKIKRVVDSCLSGLILNTTYALPLVEENGGKVVNVLSTAAMKANTNETLYCACKWGGRGYTESLRAFYKGSNVTVIGVYPGGIDTPFWNNNRDYWSKEATDKFMKADQLAKVIYDNITQDCLTVQDIVINRK